MGFLGSRWQCRGPVGRATGLRCRSERSGHGGAGSRPGPLGWSSTVGRSEDVGVSVSVRCGCRRGGLTTGSGCSLQCSSSWTGYEGSGSERRWTGFRGGA